MYHLSIGTSADRINLLDEHGICVHDWEPVAGDMQIMRSSSPLADYSRPQSYRELTTEEVFPFNIGKAGQDGVVVGLQDLRRMCRLAIDYWVEPWQEGMVYLAAQSSCETNRRYAIVHSAGVPRDDDPYGQPFVGSGRSVMVIDALGVERGPWMETAPGTATCIEACAPENYYCWPAHLEFGGEGSDDDVDCGNNAALGDLPSPDGITVEGWIRPSGWGQSNQGCIVSKINNILTVGWRFYIDAARGLCGYINFGTQDAWSCSGLDEFTLDNEWHHVAMTFHPTAAGHSGYIRLWIDGVEVSSYSTYQQGQGAYSTDAALDLHIGNHGTLNADWEGDIGWVRLSEAPIYQSDFTAPPRCEIPVVNFYYTVGAWIVEGTGGTAYNLVDPTISNGTITGAEWACDCDLSFGRMCGDLEQCFPAYLEFDGVNGYVNCGDYATIQDLPDDTKDMIAEAWVKADGWGGNNAGHIISKENHPTYTTGWNFVIVQGTGLYGYVNGAGGAAFHGFAGSGTDEFTPDGLWHHVVLAVDSAGAGNVADLYLAIDGVWVTSYSTRQQKTGGYGSDVGHTLIMGNRSDGTYCWDGDIGWVRLSDTLRYTPGVNFTPPARCTLPDVDANTAGLWIYEGAGAKTWNLAVGEPGLIYYATWACDCEIEVDQSTSCLVQPYIANYLKTSGLTHVFFNDASGSDWSDNLQYASLPHPLLPPVPAVGDAIYFGVDTTFLDTGPFCNLVFDIGTAQSGLTGQWEYWETAVGSWVTMIAGGAGPQDNTNADGLMTGETFDTLGIKSLHWDQYPPSIGPWGPVDLATATVDPAAPPITAYWVRWVVTAIGTPIPPWQQNRHIYTISWPYVEIQSGEVPGDIAASLAVELFNESDHDGGIYAPFAATSRLICGLRSLSRGEDFVAYLNASDEQNPPFISFTKTAAWTMSSGTYAPTGRYVWRTLPAATTEDAGEWTIEDGYTKQFYGEYRAFLRAITTGVAGDISLMVELTYGYGRGSSSTSDWVDSQWPFTGIYAGELFDLGRFVIPPTPWIKQSEDTPLGIVVTARNNDAGATHNVSIIDLILIPVDEWGGDFTGAPTSWSDILSGNRSMVVDDWGGKGRYVFIDSITYPKYDLRALSLIRDTGNFTGLADTIGNRPAVLHENETQRLWFLAERHLGPVSDKQSNIEICHSVQVYRQANYLSMRGNR